MSVDLTGISAMCKAGMPLNSREHYILVYGLGELPHGKVDATYFSRNLGTYHILALR